MYLVITAETKSITKTMSEVRSALQADMKGLVNIYSDIVLRILKKIEHTAFLLIMFAKAISQSQQFAAYAVLSLNIFKDIMKITRNHWM